MSFINILSQEMNKNKQKMLHIWSCEQYFHSKKLDTILISKSKRAWARSHYSKTIWQIILEPMKII